MVLDAASPEAVDTVAALLAAGGVAILPCDTLYGIVGAAPDTEERIGRIKGRREAKPLLQLVADASWVRRLCGTEAPPSLARYWPGPLTIVMPLAAGRGTVALRVPAAAWLRELIIRVGRPLYSTSVNRAGGQPLGKATEIVREFEGEVDAVLDGGDLLQGVASTIVDATSRPYRILRRGTLIPEPDDLAPEAPGD